MLLSRASSSSLHIYFGIRAECDGEVFGTWLWVTHLKGRDSSQYAVAGARGTLRASVRIKLGPGQEESLYPVDSCSHGGLREDWIGSAGAGARRHEESPLVEQLDTYPASWPPTQGSPDLG